MVGGSSRRGGGGGGGVTKVEGSGKVLLQEADESVGGRVVGADLGVVLQLRLDLLRQLLPELDAADRKQEVSR